MKFGHNAGNVICRSNFENQQNLTSGSGQTSGQFFFFRLLKHK